MIPVRVHLDSSGKLKDKWLTLAAIAGDDEFWGEFEIEWKRILAAHTPKADYVHMRELVHQIKGFDRKLGWNDENAFGLSNECLMYMSHLDKSRFRMFYCAIDLVAWRKLRAETYQIPEPIDMCNTFCSEAALYWYFPKDPIEIPLPVNTMKYFFDRNEYFFQPFFDKWNRERNLAEESGEWNIWQMIEEVAPVDMKGIPGVQAADIIAWGVNRENIAAHGKNGTGLATLLRAVVPSLYVVWDEAKMRKQFKPLIELPKGYENE